MKYTIFIHPQSLCCKPFILIYNIIFIHVRLMITRHNALAYVRCPRHEIDNRFCDVIHSININCLGKPYTYKYFKLIVLTGIIKYLFTK